MDSAPCTLSEYDPIFLLWCDTPVGRTSLEEVWRALVRSANPEGEIVALLREANWRSHLVAGVALVISEHGVKRSLVEALWGALDAGSWVAPQLGVCLALIDPNFSLQAKARIESGCRVVARASASPGEVSLNRAVEESPAGFIARFAKALAAFLKSQPRPLLLGEESARRHSKQGSGGRMELSAKALAALLYLCGLRPDCEAWLNSCRADGCTQQLLALDLDNGEKIADLWRAQFSNALSAFQSGKDQRLMNPDCC
jgi:hypothetical protein